MKKHPEVTAITRQNLIEAFWILYRQKRIDKITVKDITTIAGYNRGTFYEYFTDVYDVLAQIELKLLPTVDRLPLLELQDNGKNHDNAFNSFFKFYEENSGYLTVLLGENGDPSFLPKMKKTVIPIIKQGLLEKGAKDNFELDALIEYNISAMLGIFNLWFTARDRPPIKKFIKFIYAIKGKGETKVLNELIKNK
jgi:AcrR family transcriptional regulator